MASKSTGLGSFANSVVGMAIIFVVVFMVVPLPPVMLDVLLSMNITLALTVVLVSIQVRRPLDFSAFPTLLLITTLFRLSLNIASTRLILLDGASGPSAAGSVIKVFGSFVVGGNYVVGIILFAILVIINFVVITKGAGRIAEVAARFTLDAMPGKQMAIDADLNAGVISEREAVERRRSIGREADFYGAMDGSSKFVRGDAIAGVIITLINIVAGFIIGVVQQDLSAAEAARTYTILTVGDGLVSQIPALVISTAAGIVVTRAASDGELGEELSAQLLGYLRALYLVAAMLVGFAMMPGMPVLILLTLAASLAGFAWYSGRRTAAAEEEEEEASREEAAGEAAPTEQQRIEALLPVDLLEIEVGYTLIPLVDKEQGGDLLDRIAGLRRQFATGLGVLVPPVHVRDNLQLHSSDYAVKIKGVVVADGKVMPERLLAMNPGDLAGAVPGVATKEPAFGLDALWIAESDRDRAEALGYTVVDASTVIATHFSEVLRKHAHDLMGRQEVHALLDVFKRSDPKVVEELIPDLMSVGDVLKVLRNLLKEEVSIRDLRTVLETLADHASTVKHPDALTELVRQRMGRVISNTHLADDGLMHVVVLDRLTEDACRESLATMDGELHLAVSPEIARGIIDQLGAQAETLELGGIPQVVLVPPELRRPLRTLLERFAPDWAVLSHREVDPSVEVKCVTEIRAALPVDQPSLGGQAGALDG